MDSSLYKIEHDHLSFEGRQVSNRNRCIFIANRENPNQTSHSVASDLGEHVLHVCTHIYIWRKWVNTDASQAFKSSVFMRPIYKWNRLSVTTASSRLIH